MYLPHQVFVVAGGVFVARVTPRTVSRQAPLSVGISGQEYWSGLLFPSPGDLPTQGLNLCSLRWQADSLPLSHLGSP